jgi:urease accessory protein
MACATPQLCAIFARHASIDHGEITMPTGLRRAAALVLTLVPTAALAHTGAGDAHGAVHGFLHPLAGLDHLFAMVTVGILASQLGGRALVLLPAAFLVAMAGGGALGLAGAPLPFVETGIAASVLVLGAIVLLRVKMPVGIAIALAGLFAVFHGHAHGTEMPVTTSALSYAAGFLAATALLHGCGIAVGLALNRLAGRARFSLPRP